MGGVFLRGSLGRISKGVVNVSTGVWVQLVMSEFAATACAAI